MQEDGANAGLLPHADHRKSTKQERIRQPTPLSISLIDVNILGITSGGGLHLGTGRS
ncbi:hypothetical protein I552_4492 [Mycobacterium xenopi 3993]|nr:hypothetical protein I552_4492 [Mycobacterium xenopi 3993]